MHKPILHLSKLTTTGLFSFFGFLFVYRFAGLLRWKFDIMNNRHWMAIRQAWERGWTIDTIQEWAFLIFIASFVPLFLATWAFILRPHIFEKIHDFFVVALRILIPIRAIKWLVQKLTPEEREALLTEDQTVKAPHTDEKMPSEIQLQRRADSEKKPYFIEAQEDAPETEKEETPLPPQTEPVAKEHHAATGHTHAVKPTSQTKTEKNLDDILNRLQKHHDKPPETKETPKPQKNAPEKKEMRTDKKERKERPKRTGILGDFESKGYRVYEKVKLANQDISFLALADHKVVIGEILDQETEWLADETGLDGMPAMWTGEKGAIESPVQKLVNVRRGIKKDLVELLENETIETVLCLEKSKVNNVDDVKTKWRREGVQVVNVSKDVKTPFLKNLQDYLSEKVPPMAYETRETILKKLGIKK